MNRQTLFKLGRISNLPTVWSNTLCGAVLSGQFVLDVRLPFLLLSASLVYIAGMFLNDAFDVEHDTRHNPERPIPAGEIRKNTVIMLASALFLVAGLVCILLAGEQRLITFTLFNSLTIAIVYYDYWHKNNPYGPIVMGLCRALLILLSASIYQWPGESLLWLAAASAWLFVIGLTYTAKQERKSQSSNLLSHWPLITLLLAVFSWPLLVASRQLPVNSLSLLFLAALLLATGFSVYRFYRRKPGDIPVAVILLIGALCLLDAIWLAAAGAWLVAVVAAMGLPLTLYFQKFYRGT